MKSYQITLDGPEDQHNLTRRRADGHGTFDVIFENLLAASKTDLDFRIDIRMHLHQANVEIVKGDLTDLLIQNFSKDPRFNLHPISIGDYGGAFNDGNVTTTTHRIAADSRELILDRFASARRAHFQSIDLYSDRPIAHQSSTAAEGNAVVCYAAAANSFAIRSDGRVVKCTTALEDPRNVIGKISENGQLSINPDLVKLWMVGFASGKTGELACPLHKVSTMKVPGGKKIIPIVEQI